MKLLLPNTKCKNNDGIVLIENDQVITNALKIAKIFNDYFSEVATSNGDHCQVEDFSEHQSVKLIAGEKVLQDFSFKSVETGYIDNYIEDPREVVGVDKIYSKVIFRRNLE